MGLKSRLSKILHLVEKKLSTFVTMIYNVSFGHPFLPFVNRRRLFGEIGFRDSVQVPGNLENLKSEEQSFYLYYG